MKKDIFSQYEKVCNKIVTLFCQKQDLEFDFWAADDVGSWAFFGDYCFQFSEILFDLQTEKPKGAILSYINFCVENEKTINYRTFCSLNKINSQTMPSDVADIVAKNFELLLLNLKDNEK